MDSNNASKANNNINNSNNNINCNDNNNDNNNGNNDSNSSNDHDNDNANFLLILPFYRVSVACEFVRGTQVASIYEFSELFFFF
jgi:hypothetical protein